jgi:lauroyl/myristoyl acyltransferase
VIRSGWLALRRHTGAVIVPLLARRRGRTRIITLYPPLPPLEADPERDRAVCREVITALLQEYVRRFPEQCPCLAFWRNGRPESAH